MPAIIKKAIGSLMTFPNLREVCGVRPVVVLAEMNAQSALSFVYLRHANKTPLAWKHFTNVILT